MGAESRRRLWQTPFERWLPCSNPCRQRLRKRGRKNRLSMTNTCATAKQQAETCKRALPRRVQVFLNLETKSRLLKSRKSSSERNSRRHNRTVQLQKRRWRRQPLCVRKRQLLALPKKQMPTKTLLL